jgi:hypothetical protein
VKVTLPAGWSVQGGWDTPTSNGTKGVSVQNGKPGSDAVVVDFAVDIAATVQPDHPTPASASDALKAWTNALDDSVDQLSGPISNASFGAASNLSLSSPAFDQFMGESYTGAVNGGKNNIAGFMVSAWNSTNHHDVFAWLITSDKAHAQSALAALGTMLQSLHT